MCERREDLEAFLSVFVARLDESLLKGNDAKVLVGFFSRIEHLASAGKALCALRVANTGVFSEDGHRHVGDWLAKTTGESLGQCLSVLESAKTASELPELKEALLSGELSGSQAAQVAGAASADPALLGELLGAARSEDFEGLKRRCAQIKAAKTSIEDEAERSKRLHRSRSLRTWTEGDGTFRLDARLTPEAGAVVLARLKARADKIFVEARRQGSLEPSGAYMADALLALVTTTGAGVIESPKALAHLRVDIGALRRGNTEPGELCEIAGVGPVSVAVARELLGDSIAKVLVTSATDVHSVCNLGRAVPARVRSALLERDKCCVVPGCSSSYNLEIDHRVVPFANGGATELDNLARICHHHHFLKTHEGYSLQGEPGAWVWVHPDGTRQQQRPERPPGTTPPPRDNRPAGKNRPPGDAPPPGETTTNDADTSHRPGPPLGQAPATGQPSGTGQPPESRETSEHGQPSEPGQPSLFGTLDGTRTGTAG